MNQESRSRVAIVAGSKHEGDMLSIIVRSLGVEGSHVYTDSREAYERAVRDQYSTFIIRQEMPDLTGLALIQKLRGTGNYGMETHLVLVDTLHDSMLPLFHDLGLDYVLQKPFTAERIALKLQHMWRSERELSPFENALRNARAAWHSGLVEMARETCVQLLKDHGWNEKVLILLGTIFLFENKIDDGRKCLHAILKANPQSSAALHVLAKSHMQENDFKQAAVYLNQLVTVSPINMQGLADAGLVNLEIGDLAKARAIMQRLQGLDRHDRRAGEVLAKVAMSEGNVQDACQILAQSHSDSELIQFLNNAGVKLSQGDDVPGAIRMYQQCLEVIRENEFVHAIYYNLGLAYCKIKDHGNAARCYQLAIEHKPDFAKARTALERLALSA